MKILHITAHMGGGAGKAVSGLVLECASTYQDIEQRLLILEMPKKKKYVDMLHKVGIDIVIGNEAEMCDGVAWADVIVVSWWNHPLMSRLLVKISEQKCRLVMWVHVNGCSYPYLPYDFANIPEMLFVTTQYTLDNPLWTEEEKRQITQKTELISGIGDFKPEAIVPRERYELEGKFVVGYVGTLNYAKLHKDYLAYCQAAIARIPDIHFLMVGDDNSMLQEEIIQNGLSEYFSFTGYVDDIFGQYVHMDVLGYLLNADNYGTTENVILEAMAVGLPVVVCDNGPESYIVKQGINGYLVGSPIEYAQYLDELYKSASLRHQLGQNARDYVVREYSIEHTSSKFMESIDRLMDKPKSLHDFKGVIGTSVFEWFKYFTGSDKPFFDHIMDFDNEERKKFFQHCKPIYKEQSKSSIRHFLSYYECEELDMLRKEME